MSGIRVVNVLALLAAVVSACDASSVQGPQAPFVATYEVRFSVDDEVQLEWDGTTQLFAVPMDPLGNVLPTRPVRWLSSNAAVATVSQSGVVQAVGAGFGIITAVIDSVLVEAARPGAHSIVRIARQRRVPIMMSCRGAGTVRRHRGQTPFDRCLLRPSETGAASRPFFTKKTRVRIDA
jgi:Bacterial Ig-like domain (group 2)